MATNQVISTMAQPLMVYECRMVFEAVDPTTGAAVSGVNVQNPVIAGVNLSQADQGAGSTPPPQLASVLLAASPGEGTASE